MKKPQGLGTSLPPVTAGKNGLDNDDAGATVGVNRQGKPRPQMANDADFEPVIRARVPYGVFKPNDAHGGTFCPLSP